MPFPRLSIEQKALIVEMYLAGITPHSIAESEELTVAVVIRTLKDQGITLTRHAGRYGILDQLAASEIEAIVEGYTSGATTNRELCTLYGITMAQLWKILNVLEVPTRQFALANIESRKRRVEEAISMYQQGRPILEIKEATGLHGNVIYLELAKRKIPTRK